MVTSEDSTGRTMEIDARATMSEVVCSCLSGLEMCLHHRFCLPRCCCRCNGTCACIDMSLSHCAVHSGGRPNDFCVDNTNRDGKVKPLTELKMMISRSGFEIAHRGFASQ